MSRCHAFKKRIENSDKELQRYIKGITVIVEEPLNQLELQQQQTHHQTIQLKADQMHHRQEIHLTASDLVSANHHHHHHHHQMQNVTIQQPTHTNGPHIVTTTTHQPQQMIITNGQLHNAQIINAAGQIVATPIQSTLTTAQIQPTIQLVQTSKDDWEQLMRLFWAVFFI